MFNRWLIIWSKTYVRDLIPQDQISTEPNGCGININVLQFTLNYDYVNDHLIFFRSAPITSKQGICHHDKVSFCMLTDTTYWIFKHEVQPIKSHNLSMDGTWTNICDKTVLITSQPGFTRNKQDWFRFVVSNQTVCSRAGPKICP